MKSLKHAAPFVLALAAMLCQPAAAEIYKIVDQDGNVTYTDRPPEPGTKPVKLRELSVVERPEYQPRRPKPEQAGTDEDGEPSLRQLRRDYRDFRLSSPEPEQSFWGTGNVATIAWESGRGLRPGMTVQFLLDGEPLGGPTTNPVMATPPLDRGEHRASAELRSSGGETVATAEPVVFFIKQQSRLIPRPQPRGSG